MLCLFYSSSQVVWLFNSQVWCDFKHPFVVFHPTLVHKDQVRVLWGLPSCCSLLLDEQHHLLSRCLRYMLLLLPQCSSPGLCWCGLVFSLSCKCGINSQSHKWITRANDLLQVYRSFNKKMEKCGKHRCPGGHLRIKSSILKVSE